MGWTGAKRWVAVLFLVHLVSPAGCVRTATPPTNAAGEGGGVEVADGAEVASVQEPSGPDSAPNLSIGEDVTELVRRQNSAAFAPPSTEFRAGATSPIELAASAITRGEGTFRVRLPSGAPVTTPAIFEDLVVVSGGFRSHELFAFRAGQGDLVWAIQLDDDGPSNPACEAGVCVVSTESCTIFAVEAETGALLWSWYLGDPLMSAPSIANGLVFAAFPATPAPASADRPMPEGVSHALAAFDLRSGEVRWARWIDADVISAPVAVADAVYAATFNGTLYQLDQRTGEIRAARSARATSAPALIDGALYFSRRADEAPDVNAGPRVASRRAQESIVRSEKGGEKEEGGPAVETAPRDAEYLEYDFQDGSVYGEAQQSNDAANGFSGGAPASANAQAARQLVGRASVYGLQEYQGSWVVGDGVANFSTMGDALVSVDRQSGRERWSVRLPGDLRQLGGALGTPPISRGGTVVVATLTGEILLVDGQRGQVRRRLEVGGPVRSQPVLHRGWIYVGTADGQLVGIDSGDERLTGWVTWAGDPARTGRGLR